MATSTSLNLRAVLKAALVRSGMDVPAREVSGLTEAAKALYVAGAAQTQAHGIVLYVVPADADIEPAVTDITFFLSALEGLSQSGTAVLPFPSHEVDPYRGLAPHVGVTSARARALHAIARGTVRVIVGSAAALLPRVTSPVRLLATALDLKPGQDIAPSDLAELLVDAGFTREDPADQHGEFAVRGGIVDIFPAGASRPVRLEFIGDTIETLRVYDPATQRSTGPIDQVAIVPLRDILDGRRDASIFDYLALAASARIVVDERDEVDASALKLVEQIDRSYRLILDGGADRTMPEAADEEPLISAEEWDELSEEEDPELLSERAELKVRRKASGSHRAADRRATSRRVPAMSRLRQPNSSWLADIAARLDQGTTLAARPRRRRCAGRCGIGDGRDEFDRRLPTRAIAAGR